MKNTTQSLKIITLALVLSFGFSYVYAWTAPSTNPPTGNVSAPINTSITAQVKDGSFGVNGLLRGYGNAIVDGNMGIGTTAPNGKLQVGDYGTGHLHEISPISGATNPVRLIVNSSSTPSALTLGPYSPGYGLDLWVDTAGLAPVYFDNRNEDAIIFRRKTYTTPVESMRIDVNGLKVSGTIQSTSGGIKFPDATIQTTAASGGGLGVGQTWQTPARAAGTTYTNSTGKPIMVSVNIGGSAAGAGLAKLYVDGVIITGFQHNGYFGTGGASSPAGPLQAIVPNGSSYYVTITTGNLYSWLELR